MLLLAAALSFFSGVAYSDPTLIRSGFVILGVVVLNAVFNIVQEYRAEKLVQAVTMLIPRKVKVVRDGRTGHIDVSGIVPGDFVLLEEGDEVPADIRLVSAFDVRVNNALLTGESRL